MATAPAAAPAPEGASRGVAIPEIAIIVCYPIVMIELIFILALFVSAAVAFTQSEWARGARSSSLRSALIEPPVRARRASLLLPSGTPRKVDNPHIINYLVRNNANSSLLHGE